MAESKSLNEIIDNIEEETKEKSRPKVGEKRPYRARAGVQYPWAEIMSEYVTGRVIPDTKTGAKIHVYPTLDDLAEKYGCSPHYIKTKSYKEAWSKRREFFQSKMQERTAANRFHSVLSESASSDARTLLAIDKLYALVEAYFEQYEDMELCTDGKFRLKGYQGDSEDDEGTTRTIKVNDLKGLVDVLDKAQALVRRTVGEPVNHKQYDSLINSPVFNPMAEGVGDEKDADKAQAKLDLMIDKRNNLKKSKAEIRKEIEELREQLG